MEKEQWNNEAIRNLIATLSEAIAKDETLKDMNFALYHQHGRLAFMDLDAFAKATKVRTDEEGKEKSLEELKQELDKNEE